MKIPKQEYTVKFKELSVKRVKHYSLRTEKTYVDWIKRYIWFHGSKGHSKITSA